MKKYLAIAVVAALILGATAAIALAVEGDSTYLLWSAVSGTSGAGNGTPHGAYQTNTTKCGVCHTVHHAGPSDGTAYGEALLKSTRANACTYCHITPGVSSKRVYDNSSANYTNDTQFNHSSVATTDNRWGGTAWAGCTSCHQVHGAQNNMTGDSRLGFYILKTQVTGWDSQVTTAMITSAGSTQAAETLWCTRCHRYYDSTANKDTHMMVSSMTAGRNVAFNADPDCISCHASQNLNGSFNAAAWPHYVDGRRFLTQAATSGATAAPATSPDNDGVCLRCHTDGVGGIGMAK